MLLNREQTGNDDGIKHEEAVAGFQFLDAVL